MLIPPNTDDIFISEEFYKSINYTLPFLLKISDGETYYVLENKDLCSIFWIKYIHDVFSEQFKNQEMITSLGKIDTTLPIWINTKTMCLFKPPPSLSAVNYFYNVKFTPPQINLINFKGIVVLLVAIVSIIVVLILQYNFKLPRLF